MAQKLEIRRMGRTEMRPNALALGAAWMWQKSDAEVIEAIRRGIELGINYIDTYPGHAEHLWGEALSDGLREKIYLQAKVGTHPERTERLLHRRHAMECHKQSQSPPHGLLRRCPHPRSN